jgi:hypothetical protein
MKKTALKIFAAAAVMVAGGIALSPTASASSSPCPHDRICIFENANFHGGYKFYYRGTDVSTFNTLEQVFSNRVLTNDKISSIINNTKRRITFYSEAGFKGRYLRIAPHGQVNNLNRYHFNDTISSLNGECRTRRKELGLAGNSGGTGYALCTAMLHGSQRQQAHVIVGAPAGVVVGRRGRSGRASSSARAAA